MIFRITMMAVSAVTVLAWVWFRSRRVGRDRITPNKMPGRGVIGEATTAYEDLARQFLDEGSDRPKKLRPAKIDHSR